jgi:hypothetical protein
MRRPERDEKRRDTRYFVASEDAGHFAARVPALVDRAVGIEWYEHHGTDIDRAALALCRLRRARGGEKGSPQHGDEAVRLALGSVSTAALVWLASRAISYMDESGFPEAVEPWFAEESEGAFGATGAS